MMTDKVYQLPYDDVLDKDIHEWLKSLPRSRKAEMVRNAIRYYLQATGEVKAPVFAVPNTTQQTNEQNEGASSKKPRKRPDKNTLAGLHED